MSKSDKPLRLGFKLEHPEDKKRFVDSYCLAGISVGQSYHAGETLVAMLDKLVAQFLGVNLLIADTLQRYSMAILSNSSDPDAFYELALKEGDLWIENAKKLFPIDEKIVEVMRWNDFVQNPEFPHFLDIVRERLIQDEQCRYAFENTCREHVDRMSKNCPQQSFDYDSAYELSHKYVLEECACYCLFSSTGCQFDAYPYRYNAAMEYIRNACLQDVPSGFPTFVGIVFRNRSTIKPQNFNVLKDCQLQT